MSSREFVAKHYTSPDLDVIDRAIDSIRRRREDFSCVALMSALWEGLRAACRDLDTPAINAYYDVASLYKTQYEEFVRSQNAGHRPAFWDSYDADEHRAARIQALQDFRAACIAAANKE